MPDRGPPGGRRGAAGRRRAGEVVTTEPLGGETVVDLELGDRITKALVDPTLDLADGQPTTVVLDPRRLHLFDDAGEALLSAAGDDIFGVRVG